MYSADGIAYDCRWPECPHLPDGTLGDKDLEKNCPLDNGKHDLNPQHGLGLLDDLPLELVREVLLQSDLRSLTDFRRVSQRGMQVVDSILEYRKIIKHSPDSIRGILSVGLGSHITTLTLLNTLHESRCECCGDFAGYIYFLTCKRVCYICIEENPEYHPLLIPEAKRKFGLSAKHVASLPTIRSIPGTYSPLEKSRKTRLTLLDVSAARNLALKHHGSAEAVEEYVRDVEQRKIEASKRRRAGSSLTAIPLNTAQDTGRTLVMTFREGPLGDPKRFMAVVRAPYVDRSTGVANGGFYCRGCQEEHGDGPMYWRRRYCLETFQTHIEEYGPVELTYERRTMIEHVKIYEHVKRT